MRRLLAALAVAALAACEMPQPFRHQEPNPLLTIGPRAGMVVMPVVAAPRPAELADALTAALIEADVAATTAGGNAASYLLDGSAARDGDAVVLTWRVWAPEDRPLASHSQRVAAATLDSAEGMVLVARQAAPAIAALVAGKEPPPTAPAAPRISVRAVTGAPGDGDSTLAAALRRALAAAGYRIEASEAEADRVVQGRVGLAAGPPGHDRVSIDWVVLDRAGRELGRVRQGNDIPRGSLDGAWGPLAGLVAEAALPGVDDVLRRTRPGN